MSMYRTLTPIDPLPDGRELRGPIPFTDAHGTPCFRVPLGNAPDTFAVIDKHSYDTLISEGLTGPWFLNGNGTGRSYVRIAVPVEGGRSGTNLLVARLILGAGPGTVVRYANGDRLDLRFNNLAWRKGKSSRTDADALAAAIRLRASRSIATSKCDRETIHQTTQIITNAIKELN